MKSEEKVIIYSSFILYFIDTMLPKEDRVKGSTIRFRQRLRQKVGAKQYLPLKDISNDIWSSAIDKYKDKNMRIVIGDVIEELLFGEEKAFTSIYGPAIISEGSNMTLKITDSGLAKDIIAESREVSKTLIDLTRKAIFERHKNENN
jgi:hypothetical protein